MIGSAPLALVWRPFFAPQFTLTAALLLAGLAVWAFLRAGRRQPAAGVAALLMRWVLIAALALLLLGPSRVEAPEVSARKPLLRVLLDGSASMQTTDMEGLARYDFARERWLSSDRLAAMRRTHDVELYSFGETLRAVDASVLTRPASSSADAGVTDLAGSVSAGVATRASSGGAVLVLSDGRDTMGAPMHAVGRLARANAMPIYTVALGGPTLSRDMAVVAVPRQPYLFAAEPGSITVRVMRSNLADAGTRLHVEQAGRERVFDVDFEGKGTAAIDVPVLHDEPGAYDYRVWIDAVPGEADTANNSQPVFIEVTAKRLRVLVLEGQPYWDTKFLAHALRRDPRIELTQVTQVTPQRREVLVSREGAEAEAPATLEALGAFDVIVLGRGIENVLDERTVTRLPRYVSERGGRLVFARGRAYDTDSPAGLAAAEALGVVEPVVFGRGTLRDRRIELEPAGMMHPALGETAVSDDGPVLLNVPVIEAEKPATRVLARTRPIGAATDPRDGQPAIATMPYGQGMVVAVLGDGLWRWALRPRGGSADGFNRFWTDSVRWLALGNDFQPGRPVGVRLSRLGVQAGDPIRIDVVSRLGFEAMEAELVIESPSGERRSAALRPVPGSTTRRSAVFQPATPGVYRVVASSPRHPDEPAEARFNCYHVDIERMHRSANRGALRTLSESSGGRCLDPYDPDALPKVLEQQRRAVLEPPRPAYLWDRGWVMSLILAWAGAEWLIRRAGGLP
jgi:hypothetical protein